MSEIERLEKGMEESLKKMEENLKKIKDLESVMEMTKTERKGV